MALCCRIVRCSSQPASDFTSETLNLALIKAIIDSSNHPNSLLKRKRGHRSGNDFNPFGTILRHYHVAATRLAEHLGIPSKEVIGAQEARRRAEREDANHGDFCDVEEFDDVLSTAEMENAIKACCTPMERVVMLLLCRLGMRIGAIADLRMSGVLANYDTLRPGQERWAVSETIAGLDKQDKINRWHLKMFPCVIAALDEYINNEWRPRFERWDESDPLRPRLQQCCLFPARCRVSVYQPGSKPLSRQRKFQIMIRSILQRVGVSGPRAHAHAFRKTVVTGELIGRYRFSDDNRTVAGRKSD